MNKTKYQYKECGLSNVYLVNGFNIIETPLGKAVSVHDVDGLHIAIGMFLISNRRDLSGDEIRFLRNEMLMSQKVLSALLGISEQELRRWETGKIKIPKPPESLLRLLYRSRVNDPSGEIEKILREISRLEGEESENQLVFKDTKKGWQAAA